MLGPWLIPVTILVPLAGALLLMIPAYRKNISVVRTTTGAFVAATGLLVVAVAMLGEAECEFLEILPDMPVFFRSDRTSVWFSVLTVAMWMCSTVFSFEYMKHEKREERYCVFSLLALTALMGVCFSGNLITTYLFYEIMTFASFPLVLHEQTKEAVSAGLTYLYYSLAGAFLGLVGIFFLYRYAAPRTVSGGLLAYAAGGFLRTDLTDSERSLLTVVIFLMLIGLGSKVGLYPLHGWLPKAHPVAPAPASALLSGNITKMGILFTVRILFFAVGPDFLRGSWAQYALLGLSLLTVFLGSMLAYREKVFKKRLAYSTVSQTSYVLTGLYLLAPVAAVGALLHVVFHSIIKNLLFLCAGAIIYKTGRTKVEQLKGIGLIMPVTMVCFTVGGLALVGIPPFAGFISKWYLAAGALDTDTGVLRFLVPVILIISALLTAGYLLTVSADAFFVPRKEGEAEEEKREEPAKGPEVSLKMLIPLVLLSAAALAFGLFPGVLTDFLNGIMDVVF